MRVIRLLIAIVALLALPVSAKDRAANRCPWETPYGVLVETDLRTVGTGDDTCWKIRPGDTIHCPYAHSRGFVVRSAEDPGYVPDHYPCWIAGLGPAGVIDRFSAAAVDPRNVSPCAWRSQVPWEYLDARWRSGAGLFPGARFAQFAEQGTGRSYDSLIVPHRTGPWVDVWLPYLPCDVDWQKLVLIVVPDGVR